MKGSCIFLIVNAACGQAAFKNNAGVEDWSVYSNGDYIYFITVPHLQE